MIQVGRVQDAVRRGLDRAGQVAGEWCALFRPDGLEAPLAAGRQVRRLMAAFVAPEGGMARPPVHGRPWWHGVFDAAATRPGDYLRRGDGAVWFVATLPALQPALCVRANRVVDVLRPRHAGAVGLAGYGGEAGAPPVLRAWPASLLRGEGGGWTVLLPPVAGAVLREGDLVADDLGRRGVVAQAEFSEPGWRLAVRRTED